MLARAIGANPAAPRPASRAGWERRPPQESTEHVRSEEIHQVSRETARLVSRARWAEMSEMRTSRARFSTSRQAPTSARAPSSQAEGVTSSRRCRSFTLTRAASSFHRAQSRSVRRRTRPRRRAQRGGPWPGQRDSLGHESASYESVVLAVLAWLMRPLEGEAASVRMARWGRGGPAHLGGELG